ncbi:hypothetical protein [Bacillus infantis]|uniref:hypothetical protein n=1 Tax=Bacillus infantis TaxID=324767 RepID=UPI003CF8AA44
MEKELLGKVVNFMVENDVTCEETIYQTDRVIENAYEFIGELFNIVKPLLPKEETE